MAVSHVSPIKAAAAWALGVDGTVAWRMFLGLASITRVGRGRTSPVLLSFNETGHLRAVEERRAMTEPTPDHGDPGVAAAGRPPPRPGRRPPAHAVRRRPRAGRDDDRRGGRPAPRLLQEPGHTARPSPCWRPWPSGPTCRGCIEAMLRGERINTTEDRPVLHVALRMPRGSRLIVDGEDVVRGRPPCPRPDGAFADQVRFGQWLGATGRPIRNVVNIGIGGSDLGPAMAYDALRAFADPALTVRFVSNVDGTDVWQATRDLDPAETLFIVCSKTFTTLETLTNARTARAWLVGGLGDEARRGPALRGRVDQRRQGGRVRHRPRQHVRLLGLGRRPLLGRLRHRPVAHDRHRARRPSGSSWPASTPSTSTSARRRSSQPAGAARA